MKKAVNIIFILSITLSNIGCDRFLQSFVIENDSDRNIQLSFLYKSELEKYGKDEFTICDDNGDGIQIFFTASDTINDIAKSHSKANVLYAPLNTYWDAWIKEGDAIVMYIFDMDILRGLIQHKSESYRPAILQIYYLSLDDLNSLDFRLSYPPKSNMQYIKMLPTYEDAIAGKTLQDLEQEEQ